MSTLRDFPSHHKPRERLEQFGVKALSDAELLAILLSSGNRNEHVINLAQRILQLIPISRLHKGIGQLTRFEGVGKAKACTILAAFELATRAQHSSILPEELCRPKDVFTYMLSKTRNTQESLWGIYLDVRKKVVAVHQLFIGTLDTLIVHPREIFSHALHEHAAAIIIVHNHPSGDPSPSDEDIQFTNRLVDAAQLMGIELCDHLIITTSSYFSFSEHSLL